MTRKEKQRIRKEAERIEEKRIKKERRMASEMVECLTDEDVLRALDMLGYAGMPKDGADEDIVRALGIMTPRRYWS